MIALNVFDQEKFLTCLNKNFFWLCVDDLTAIRAERHDTDTDRVVRRLLKIHIQFNGDGAAAPDYAAFIQAILKAILAIGWHNANAPATQIFGQGWLSFPAYCQRLFCTITSQQATIDTVGLI